MTDSKNGPKSGKYLENLGWYDTRIKNKTDQMDTEKMKYWISKGAKLSVTLHNYLVTQKVITAKKINALPKKSPIKKEPTAEEKAKSAEAPKAAPATEATPTPVPAA